LGRAARARSFARDLPPAGGGEPGLGDPGASPGQCRGPHRAGRGRSLRHRVLGSVSAEVAADAPCSVTEVRRRGAAVSDDMG
jgi:hypothetical protein